VLRRSPGTAPSTPASELTLDALVPEPEMEIGSTPNFSKGEEEDEHERRQEAGKRAQPGGAELVRRALGGFHGRSLAFGACCVRSVRCVDERD